MDEKKQREQLEANDFARCLLMPKEFVFQDIKKWQDRSGIELVDEAIPRLAKQYGVSERMMEYRLIELGIQSPI